MLNEPRLEKGPGVRGSIAFFVKCVIRKLTRWYIEPRFVELRGLTEDQKRTIIFLRKELDLVHRELSQVSLRLHQLEQDQVSNH